MTGVRERKQEGATQQQNLGERENITIPEMTFSVKEIFERPRKMNDNSSSRYIVMKFQNLLF